MKILTLLFVFIFSKSLLLSQDSLFIGETYVPIKIENNRIEIIENSLSFFKIYNTTDTFVTFDAETFDECLKFVSCNSCGFKNIEFKEFSKAISSQNFSSNPNFRIIHKGNTYTAHKIYIFFNQNEEYSGIGMKASPKPRKKSHPSFYHKDDIDVTRIKDLLTGHLELNNKLLITNLEFSSQEAKNIIKLKDDFIINTKWQK